MHPLDLCFLDRLFFNTIVGECLFEDPKLCSCKNIVGDNLDWDQDSGCTSLLGQHFLTHIELLTVIL